MQDSANYDGAPGQPITDPLQMVLSEYRHELTGEYSTFFDLVRAGTDVAIDFINKANGAVAEAIILFQIRHPAQHMTDRNMAYIILPLTRTGHSCQYHKVPGQSNPNLTQNPGY